MRRTLAALALTLAVVAGLAVPAAAPVLAAAADGPKVVIIVGATHGATAKYRSYADAAYAEAIKYTANVIKVYSPNATWSKVKAAAVGANIVIYFGHGNGWPSPYTYDPNYTTKDGFGLNATAGDGDYNNKYYGEPYVSTLDLAPNALVMLHHLCYASGNSEPGDAQPSITTARKRIDNYGAGFLKSKAQVVLADGHRGPVDYLRAIFTTDQTIEQIWRNAPNANGNTTAFASSRTPGATALMDPDSPTSGFYRSLVGDLGLSARQITGGFTVPGRAAPKVDGAPIYDVVPTATTTAAVEPTGTLPVDTRLRILAKAAGSGDNAIYQVEGLDDPAIGGYMVARDLVPRDSRAPYLIALTGGDGKAYTTVATDGVHHLVGTLNEAADWTVTISRGDTTLASESGSGSTFDVALDATAAGGDGRYAYRVTGVDEWDNGPSAMTGTFVIDTVAPALSAVSPSADPAPWISPNGDLARETVAWAATMPEAGSVGLRIVDADGDAVRRLRVTAAAGTTSVVWNGRDDEGAIVPDGDYEALLIPRDAAGNDGPAVTRPLTVETSLGDVDASTVLLYPQDADRLAKNTTLRFRLTREATVTWTVTDANGKVVRTLLDGATLPAGLYTQVFDGRRDDGTFPARGTYRSVVTLAGDASPVVNQARVFKMTPFDIKLSDSTPGRGQRITVYVTSAESLSSTPRVGVYQPGLSGWSVATTKVSTGKYKVTLTLKSSGRTGTVRFKVVAADADGRSQWSDLYAPLH